MKTIRFLAIFLANILINGCSPLKPPTIIKNATIEGYRYILISPTSNLTSGSGGVYGREYGLYGASTSKSVNPSDVISGILLKDGYTRVPELKPELIDELLL